MNYLNTSAAVAVSRARNLRNGMVGFQASVGYIVAQLVQGNPNALNDILVEAGLLGYKDDGTAMVLAQGRQLVAYLQDGLGLKDVFRWNKDKQRFVYTKAWKATVEELDLAKVATTLAEVMWHHFGKAKADNAFDLEKAVLRLVKKAKEEGIKADQIRKAVERRLAA